MSLAHDAVWCLHDAACGVRGAQELWVGVLRSAGTTKYTFITTLELPEIDGVNVNDYVQLVEPGCLEE